MSRLFARLASWWCGEQGQDLTEYVLLIVLIALVVMLAISGMAQAEAFGWTDAAAALVALLGG